MRLLEDILSLGGDFMAFINIEQFLKMDKFIEGFYEANSESDVLIMLKKQ